MLIVKGFKVSKQTVHIQTEDNTKRGIESWFKDILKSQPSVSVFEADQNDYVIGNIKALESCYSLQQLFKLVTSTESNDDNLNTCLQSCPWLGYVDIYIFASV